VLVVPAVGRGRVMEQLFALLLLLAITVAAGCVAVLAADAWLHRTRRK